MLDNVCLLVAQYMNYDCPSSSFVQILQISKFNSPQRIIFFALNEPFLWKHKKVTRMALQAFVKNITNNSYYYYINLIYLPLILFLVSHSSYSNKHTYLKCWSTCYLRMFCSIPILVHERIPSRYCRGKEKEEGKQEEKGKKPKE